MFLSAVICSRCHGPVDPADAEAFKMLNSGRGKIFCDDCWYFINPNLAAERKAIEEEASKKGTGKKRGAVIKKYTGEKP